MKSESPDDRLPSPSAPPVIYMVSESGARGTADLTDLFVEMWQRKWLLLAIAFAFSLAGVAWALLATPIYRVEVVLAPVQPPRGANVAGRLGGLASLAGLNLGSGGDDTQAIAILGSRAFAEAFIADNNLLPVLFPDEWDAAGKKWASDDPVDQPTLWDGVKYIQENVLSVEQDAATGLATLMVEWADAKVAAVWAQQLVDRINEQLRKRDLDQAERKLKYLSSELEGANLLEVREAIASIIEEQVQIIALARGETEYAFRVIDPPRVPNKRVRPMRALIVVLAALAGGLVGTCVILVSRIARDRRTSAGD